VKDQELNPAVFIEVPKPINTMGVGERDKFVEELIRALIQSGIEARRSELTN